MGLGGQTQRPHTDKSRTIGQYSASESAHGADTQVEDQDPPSQHSPPASQEGDLDGHTQRPHADGSHDRKALGTSKIEGE